ncbi:MFS transporter [soil metagenome]
MADVNRDDGDHRPVPAMQAWCTVGVLQVIGILSYLDRNVLALMVEPIRASLGISDFGIGLIHGVGFGVFYALFGLPIGWLVDRVSRRWIIYLGTSCWSVAAAACGLANSFQHLLAARLAVGVGEASLSPSAYSMIADLFPRWRLSLALSIFGIGSVLGSAVAFIGGGAAIAHFQTLGPQVYPLVGLLQPWQMVFIVTGAPGIVIALLMFLVPEPKRQTGKREEIAMADAVPPSERQRLWPFMRLHWRFFTCHFLGFGLLAAATYAGLAWIPTMLVRRFHTPIGEVGMLMGTVSLTTGIAGFLLSGWIVDRWFARGRTDAHQRYYAIVNVGAALVSVFVFLFAGSPILVVMGWALITLVQPFTGPSAAQLQIITPPYLRGQVSALYVMVFNLMGMCLGPPLVAFITDYVLQDPAKLNVSLAISYGGLAGLSALAFLFGLAPSRRAIAQAG